MFYIYANVEELDVEPHVWKKIKLDPSHPCFQHHPNLNLQLVEFLFKENRGAFLSNWKNFSNSKNLSIFGMKMP